MAVSMFWVGPMTENACCLTEFAPRLPGLTMAAEICPLYHLLFSLFPTQTHQPTDTFFGVGRRAS